MMLAQVHFGTRQLVCGRPGLPRVSEQGRAAQRSECCDCDGKTFTPAMSLQTGMPVDVSFSAGWYGLSPVREFRRYQREVGEVDRVQRTTARTAQSAAACDTRASCETARAQPSLKLCGSEVPRSAALRPNPSFVCVLGLPC